MENIDETTFVGNPKEMSSLETMNTLASTATFLASSKSALFPASAITMFVLPFPKK